MFDVYCPECAGKQLIFPSQVTRISNEEAGIVVHFTCWCGSQGTWRTGSAVPHEQVSWPEHALAS